MFQRMFFAIVGLLIVIVLVGLFLAACQVI